MAFPPIPMITGQALNFDSRRVEFADAASKRNRLLTSGMFCHRSRLKLIVKQTVSLRRLNAIHSSQTNSLLYRGMRLHSSQTNSLLYEDAAHSSQTNSLLYEDAIHSSQTSSLLYTFRPESSAAEWLCYPIETNRTSELNGRIPAHLFTRPGFS